MRRESASTNRVGDDADLRECHHAPGATAHVIDDLAGVVPISARELDVIETYLGEVLNGLLGRGK